MIDVACDAMSGREIMLLFGYGLLMVAWMIYSWIKMHDCLGREKRLRLEIEADKAVLHQMDLRVAQLLGMRALTPAKWKPGDPLPEDGGVL